MTFERRDRRGKPAETRSPFSSTVKSLRTLRSKFRHAKPDLPFAVTSGVELFWHCSSQLVRRSCHGILSRVHYEYIGALNQTSILSVVAE